MIDSPPRSAPIIRFQGGLLLRKHTLQPEDLWVQGGKVVAPSLEADQEVNVVGKIVAPGYIDLQLNGAYGVDFLRNPEKWTYVATRLPRTGVTAFLATIISSSQEVYQHTISCLQPQRGPHASLLGIHLEGPFINRAFAGAHDPVYLLDRCDLAVYHSLQGVKLVTLAPELPQAYEVIKKLSHQGIAVALGHTNATIAETAGACTCGARMVTHLFNAMRPFHHREPGIIGKALTDPDLFYGIIADGLHVHPSVLHMAWKANPTGLCLVTDSMEACGLPEGSYHLGTQSIDVSSQKATLANTKTLAGSLLTLDQAVKNLILSTGCPIPAALEAASLRPAQMLQIAETKGHLDIGADADFLFLDEELNVQATYIGGSQVY